MSALDIETLSQEYLCQLRDLAPGAESAAARREIEEAFLAFARPIAEYSAKYFASRSRLPYSDCYAEACVGLLAAIRGAVRANPENFTTYAKRCCKSAIYHLAVADELIRRPYRTGHPETISIDHVSMPLVARESRISDNVRETLAEAETILAREWPAALPYFRLVRDGHTTTSAARSLGANARAARQTMRGSMRLLRLRLLASA